MKRKKGFIAISLIYSFFLVFLMLMVGILGRSVENRLLIGNIKKDIREDIESQPGFVIDSIENKNYNPGDIVSFASESWKVIEDKDSSVVLLLNRSLTKNEMELNLGKSSSNKEYYDACDDTLCNIRMCREAFSGEEYCFLYSDNMLLYRIPSWLPTINQIREENYGQTIVSSLVLSWFRTHPGLQKVLAKDKLVMMTFSDGTLSNEGYIRLPLASEMNTSILDELVPFHLLDKESNTETKIYNGSVETVLSNKGALVRPVIEVVKG